MLPAASSLGHSSRSVERIRERPGETGLYRTAATPSKRKECSLGTTRKPDRAWCQQVHDQPVAVEATGDEAKSEAQC